MLRSLVGSEMCIRDRVSTQSTGIEETTMDGAPAETSQGLYLHPHDQIAATLESITDFHELYKDFADFFAAVFSHKCLADVDRPGLFANVKRWALEALQEGPLEVEYTNPQESGKDVREFSAKQCRGILANAMLSNVRDFQGSKWNKGGLNFRRMMLGDRVGLQKVVALLVYFAQTAALEGTEDDHRQVRFEHLRTASPDDLKERMCKHGAALDPSSVRLHNGTMEQPAASSFVNFANENFGYGCFIPSCTQEEILQVCCPEFNVGMTFIGCMAENEVRHQRGPSKVHKHLASGSQR
eukprot:TRINITY_DN3308_c0_g1_i14.p1 TRINITY_DN3308_c0_g1~~TRINITY_DN3308_c0_g1_i14.p1  ORF type:complete len:314 (+),score=100.04 TRINITY_DN3308_c0_g1_i14:52-942(+)